jgi:predicted O-methyltransferase YrrM
MLRTTQKPRIQFDYGFRYGLRVLKVSLRHPAEALDRIRGRFDLVKDASATEQVTVVGDPDWHRHIHEALGAPWPCEYASEIDPIWKDLSRTLDGAPLGSGHDSNLAMASALWCLVRHSKPQRIIETGVARGIGSRFMLEALEANGTGHLWSIDLPPIVSGWHASSIAAVPQRLRSRWTFLRGASRRRLPALLKKISDIDIFVHDSLHTDTNMRFEFASAWPALRPSGVLVSDDIWCNRAFTDFVSEQKAPSILVRENPEDIKAFGIAFKRGSGVIGGRHTRS